jgi:hypothetical protein
LVAVELIKRDNHLAFVGMATEAVLSLNDEKMFVFLIFFQIITYDIILKQLFHLAFGE